MKTLTVSEAQGRLPELIAAANNGEVVVLRDGEREVTLQPARVVDPIEDSPELEAELLKAVNGPHTPYSSENLRARTDRVIRNLRK